MKEALRALAGGRERSVPQAVFFEGREGLKKIYLSMLRQAPEGSTMAILRDEFVWRPEWAFVFEEDWHERVRRLRAGRDIRTRLLVNDSALERGKAAFYAARKGLEVRFLPPGRPVRGLALYVAGDIVSILSIAGNDLAGIKIANRHLAAGFRPIGAEVLLALRRD